MWYVLFRREELYIDQSITCECISDRNLKPFTHLILFSFIVFKTFYEMSYTKGKGVVPLFILFPNHKPPLHKI